MNAKHINRTHAEYLCMACFIGLLILGSCHSNSSDETLSLDDLVALLSPKTDSYTSWGMEWKTEGSEYDKWEGSLAVQGGCFSVYDSRYHETHPAVPEYRESRIYTRQILDSNGILWTEIKTIVHAELDPDTNEKDLQKKDVADFLGDSMGIHRLFLQGGPLHKSPHIISQVPSKFLPAIREWYIVTIAEKRKIKGDIVYVVEANLRQEAKEKFQELYPYDRMIFHISTETGMFRRLEFRKPNYQPVIINMTRFEPNKAYPEKMFVYNIR